MIRITVVIGKSKVQWQITRCLNYYGIILSHFTCDSIFRIGNLKNIGFFIPRPQSAYIDINGTAAAAPGRHRGSRHAILLSRKPCIGERPYRYACGRKQQAVSCNSGFRQMLSHSYMFPPDCLTIPIISAPQKNCIFPPAL